MTQRSGPSNTRQDQMYPPNPSEIKERVNADSLLRSMFTWVSDWASIPEATTLAMIKAINAFTRGEIVGDKRDCWAAGNYVNNIGKCVEDPNESLDKAFRDLSNLQDSDNVRKDRIEAYLASRFYGDWKNAVESGETSEIGGVIEKYGQHSEIMSTNSYVGGMSFSGFNPDQVINGAILGDGPIAGKVEICTGAPGQTNCVDPTNVQDIWEDFGRHVQVIFKGLEIPGLPEWMPFPAVLELPTLGDIWDRVTSPFEEEYNRQLEECVDGGKSVAECEEEINAAGILTGVITQGASDIADATGEKVGEIIDKGLEGIDCVLNPDECAGKIKDILGGVFQGEGDIWGSVDPSAPGIPDWLKVIIIGGQYGDEVLGALEGILDNDIDGNGTIGIPITGTKDCTNEAGEVYATVGVDEECPEPPPVDFDVDCASFNKSGGMVESEEQCGGCLDDFDPDGQGGCIEAPIKCEGEQVYDDLTGECKDPDPGFVQGEPCKTEAGESGTYDEDGGCVEDPPQQCENGASNFPDCDLCSDESLPSDHENGDCSQPRIATQVQCPDNTPNAGQMVDKLSECGEPTNASGYDCTQPRPAGFTFGTVAWNQNCETTHCTDGTIKDDAVGSNCWDYVAPETGTDGTSEGVCDQQNRETNEDGSCGGCKAGYTLSENTDEGCVQDPDYVGPEGGEEGGESSGGGGGGGGGGGYSTPGPDVAFDIAGQPELLQRQRFGGTQQTPDTLASLFAEKPRSAELQDFPIMAFLQKGRIA